MSLSKYNMIYCERQLHAGDHISWKTKLISGISNHHAIVVAPKGENRFRVIHVVNDGGDGYSIASGLPISSSYSVREQIVDLSQQMSKETLCCYYYEPRKCNEPAEVIQNARSKIGKFDYDALNNNDEHFARWCKTDNNKIKAVCIIVVLMIVLGLMIIFHFL